ncbi:MAG: hypothetical protein JNK76_12715 [Planctomycetales bacterium]|nr:hypothetical protein [Planctomycetales bacterium]MBN8624938.1 hypothetical protein [Planctomycetota bacterium]
MAVNRRDFLGSLPAAAALFANGSLVAAEPGLKSAARSNRPPKRVAMINSIYRFRSHAYHLGRRILHGYDREGFHHQPDMQLVRMFNDQYPAEDMSREESKRYGYEVVKTPVEALGPSGKLDVDAVLLVVEHGDYKTNEFDQVLYPRYELFQEIVKVFEAAGRSVPVFVDKHLSYDAARAREMYDTAKRLKFGLMAGSSLPVTWRRPELEPPVDTALKEGLVAFGFDRGPAEIYFFHALETLQCLMERRRGGETGVRRVTGLTGSAVWKAGDEGLWSWELLEAALARNPSNNTGDVRENVRNPQALLIEYADGTRGAAINLIEQVSEFSFAGRVDGRDRPLSTHFVLPAPPGANFFDGLMWNIERFIATGRAPYPVERTLLTSTMLDLGMRSIKRESKPQESELLDVRYRAPSDSGFSRGRMTREG